ncbi:MAG: cation:proton antiporter [Phycisphaerae bacterium]|nr:cation:proton antiporter [Phycisphaerae bacterium]
MHGITALLVQIAVILTLSRILGLAMRLVRQPQVVGEMIAGIMLGPSLLGLFHHGQWMNALFPKDTLGSLDVLAQLGVMLFMFLVGLELDPKLLRGQGKAALVTGTVGILFPFIAGASLAEVLIKTQPGITGEVSSPLTLWLFMGAAMSITAFPVLARILSERNLQKTRSGVLALTCAAMDDVMGWCILAFVLAVAQLKGFGTSAHHGSALHSALITVTGAAVYIAFMVLGVRRILGKLQALFELRGYLSQGILALIFVLLIASALATDLIGIHQIFGAFMFGAIMPKDTAFLKHLTEKIEDFAILFLLPLFFAFTGIRTQLGLLGSPQLWTICGVIVVVAVIGKFGGVALAARFYGMNWRESSLLGVLMNTRGLMELIILNIGLSYGVLSPSLFAMMVVMALSTTFMTTPFMRLLYSPQRQKRELDEASRAEAAKVPGVHVVVPVSLTTTAPRLVRISRLLMGETPGRIYALHLERPNEVNRHAFESSSHADRVLTVAQRAAAEVGVPVNTLSFVSRHIGRDIADATHRYLAGWIVLGWHKPVFFRNVLGGVVGEVLLNAHANVAIFCDKGLGHARRIVVPQFGSAHDRDALMAADRISRQSDVSITILQMGPPQAQETDAEAEPIIPPRPNVNIERIETTDFNAAIAEASANFDLMILALSQDWNKKTDDHSRQHETIARLSQCSLLIVHLDPRSPVVPSEEEIEPETTAQLVTTS